MPDGLSYRPPEPSSVAVHVGSSGAVTAPTVRYQRVMIVLEEAVHAASAVACGVELARMHGAEVVFLHLPDEAGSPQIDATGYVHVPDEALARAVADRTRRRRDASLRAARKAGVSARMLTLGEAPRGSDIAERARGEHCDIVVIASEGRNAVVRLVTGSLIPGLITAASTPVLVCRGSADAPRNGVVRRRPRRKPLRPVSVEDSSHHVDLTANAR